MNDVNEAELLKARRKNPDLDRAVVGCLVDWVEARGTTVTYGELAELVGAAMKEHDPSRSGRMSPLGLSHPLGRIQGYCKALHLPVLPAMVVNKRTRVPGPGFEKANDFWFPENAGRDTGEIVAEAQAGVQEGVDWSELRVYPRCEEGPEA